MRKQSKQTFSAVPAEQELPSGKPGPAPVADADTVLTAARASRSELGLHTVQLAGWLPKTGFQGVEDPAAPPVLGQQLAPHDRVLLEISRHAVELREFHAASISVVLRPDADTELVLHLKQQDDMVEVNARFERGDFEHLKAHWGQLQQALGSQGIRVNALEEPPNFGRGNLASQDQSQANPEKTGERGGSHGRRQTAADPDDVAFVGALTEPPRRRAGRGGVKPTRLWETWA
jgi:hypothetical protein